MLTARRERWRKWHGLQGACGLQFSQRFGDRVHQEEVLAEMSSRRRAAFPREVVEQRLPEVSNAATPA